MTPPDDYTPLQAIIDGLYPVADAVSVNVLAEAVLSSIENAGFEIVRKEHDLFKTGDPDAPDVIRDRNGEVVLGLCKRCGRAEIELSQPCTEIVRKEDGNAQEMRRLPEAD